MSEQEFEKYLLRYYVKTGELLSDFLEIQSRDYALIAHAWQACAEHKDKIIEQQAEEIEALRGFAEIICGGYDWSKKEIKEVAQDHNLIDESGKPTKLLTGESE